ncbi:MAG: hypothetical protein HND52_19775 [Ignavibacteriae bacterium]|nr:hypothetical protein [Ignavibacteriota bacterium]NOH00208.1 hypothetical protein [Ignavibacteriota bacterium]
MKNTILYIKLFLVYIFISACFIGVPPIEESPVFFVNNNSKQVEYCTIDSLLGISLRMDAGYFYDSVQIFCDIRLKIENFGSTNIYFDSNSIEITSKNINFEFIAMDPEKINLNPNTECDIQFLLKSNNRKFYSFSNILKDELSSINLVAEVNGTIEVIISELRFKYL